MLSIATHCHGGMSEFTNQIDNETLQILRKHLNSIIIVLSKTGQEQLNYQETGML
jgi:hypothetical protein